MRIILGIVSVVIFLFLSILLAIIYKSFHIHLSDTAKIIQLIVLAAISSYIPSYIKESRVKLKLKKLDITYSEKILNTISTEELSNTIYNYMQELSNYKTASNDMTDKFENFLFNNILKNDQYKNHIYNVILKELQEQPLPISSSINNLYINLGLGDIIKQIINNNDIIEKFSIKELLLALDEDIYEEKATYIITSLLQNKLDTFTLLEYDLIISYFQDKNLNKKILDILSNKSINEIQSYITNNTNANIIFHMAYVDLLLQTNQKDNASEYVNDLLQENWSNYEIFDVVFTYLTVKDILNKEDYKDAIKQKSTLEIFYKQTQEQEKQRAELEKINKTQQDTINNLSNLSDRIEESNKMQQEQLNIQKTQRAEELAKREYINNEIKKAKRKKLIKKIF